MRRPAISTAPWLLAALLVPAWLAGCSPTATYGTGEAPEMALFREMTGGLLSRDKKEPIEYQPRAPLVVPPSPEKLPEPRETAAATSPDWPVDPDSHKASVRTTEEGDLRYGAAQAEYRRLKPLAGVLPKRKNPVQRRSEHAAAYDIVNSKQQREQFRKALAEKRGLARSERRFLTDPPTEYRKPAETAPAEFEDIDTSGGGGSWFGWLLGSR